MTDSDVIRTEMAKVMTRANPPIIMTLEDVAAVVGMTLRDYFAAKALAALIIGDQGDLPHRLGAVDAYRYADEMLEARK